MDRLGRSYEAAVFSERERHALKALRISRGGPSLFYLGPNDRWAQGLAQATEDLPLSVSYYWSSELLNKAPFFPFVLGLCERQEWNHLMTEAHPRMRQMLSLTPVYLFSDTPDGPIAEDRFPTWILGVLYRHLGMGAVVAEIVGTLGRLEKQEGAGKNTVAGRRITMAPKENPFTPAFSFALIDDNAFFANLLWTACRNRQIRLDTFASIAHYHEAKRGKYEVILIDYNLGPLAGLSEPSVELGIWESLGSLPLLLLTRQKGVETVADKPFMKKIGKDFNMDRLIDSAIKLRYEFIRAA